MGIIKAAKLAFDYLRYDEDGNVEDTQRAVDGVDLDIQPGEFVAVLGHNGSGKSTFAKHINALLLPTEGTIWIDGIDTAKEPELWKVRQKAGMVFQNPDNQIIGTVVEEDVGFGPENMGISTGDIWKRVDESLAKTGMTAYRHHSPNKLSGGQKQRISIARALLKNAPILILDDSVSAVDTRTEKIILDNLKTTRAGKTTLLIAHRISTVEGMDKIVFLEDGRVEAVGTHDALYHSCPEYRRMVDLQRLEDETADSSDAVGTSDIADSVDAPEHASESVEKCEGGASHD